MSTPTEIEAAAERVSEWIEDTAGIRDCFSWNDIKTIAKAYLADRAARLAQEAADAKPITPVRLWASGANEGVMHTEFEREFAFWSKGDHDCSDGVIVYVRRTGADVPYFARIADDDGIGVMLDIPLVNMGDIRRLIEALGVKP